MSRNNQTILVFGANGSQGGAVTRHLLKNNWKVRAFVRDTQKPAAQQFAAQGVEIVQGDLNDAASIEKAMQGVYGVFSVQTWGEGTEVEIAQGKRVADAAKAAGVQHFVYSSVGGADQNTHIHHFDSKWEIEQHIHALALPYTIVRPVFFMDNYQWIRPLIENGGLSLVKMNPDIPLQMIAVDDVGGMVALAFERPVEFLGQTLELAGDEMTLNQQAALFSKILNRSVSYAPEMIQSFGYEEEFDTMYNWFEKVGYSADITALRQIYPPLLTFNDWLQQNWSK